MARHYRVLFPVGQGGFAFESIDGFSVVFDCGSVSAPTRVKHYVDVLQAHDIKEIDNLILSHYDMDHVNGIEYLMSKIHVRTLLAPHIPANLRIVYDLVTHEAYFKLLALAQNKETEIKEVNEEGLTLQNNLKQPIWEWFVQSMLTKTDFSNLSGKLVEQELDTNRLAEDQEYVVQHREKINIAFIKAFGSLGPNAKGLITLSQKVRNAVLDHSEIETGCRHCYYCHCLPTSVCRDLHENIDKTSCFYLGDARLKTRASMKSVKDFLVTAQADDPLCLMQIPHHGSQYNFTTQLDTDFPALYYCVHDRNEGRIKNSESLYNRLVQGKQLLMIRDICQDLILQISEVH